MRHNRRDDRVHAHAVWGARVGDRLGFVEPAAQLGAQAHGEITQHMRVVQRNRGVCKLHATPAVYPHCAVARHHHIGHGAVAREPLERAELQRRRRLWCSLLRECWRGPIRARPHSCLRGFPCSRRHHMPAMLGCHRARALYRRAPWRRARHCRMSHRHRPPFARLSHAGRRVRRRAPRSTSAHR